MNPVVLLRALAFAAERHRTQQRKSDDPSPYINHPIVVARVLADEGGVVDEDLLVAAVLHDTVEDTDTSPEEIEILFGKSVSDIVRELTDDKSLPKEERKRLQVVNAPRVSPAAKQLKIADKICNVRDVAFYPPPGWDMERRQEYLSWATRVVDGCRGVNSRLDEAFDATLARAQFSLEGQALGSGAAADVLDEACRVTREDVFDWVPAIKRDMYMRGVDAAEAEALLERHASLEVDELVVAVRAWVDRESARGRQAQLLYSRAFSGWRHGITEESPSVLRLLVTEGLYKGVTDADTLARWLLFDSGYFGDDPILSRRPTDEEIARLAREWWVEYGPGGKQRPR